MASPAGRCKFQALFFSMVEIKSFDELFEKTRYGGCWFWQMCWNNMKYSVF
jgi:hypothetical protein